jgi:hypothetical protein
MEADCIKKKKSITKAKVQIQMTSAGKVEEEPRHASVYLRQTRCLTILFNVILMQILVIGHGKRMVFLRRSPNKVSQRFRMQLGVHTRSPAPHCAKHQLHQTEWFHAPRLKRFTTFLPMNLTKTRRRLIWRECSILLDSTCSWHWQHSLPNTCSIRLSTNTQS